MDIYKPSRKQVEFFETKRKLALWDGIERKNMSSIFNQMIRGGGIPMTEESPQDMVKPRTFKETLTDQIAYHERKIAELKAVRDSLTPELEKFVEALQKLG